MNLSDWIGKSESVSDVATATPYAALSATLDYPPQRPAPGTPLPPLWHWLYFLPLYRQSEVGADGHPKRGGFLPPVPLPRRMWAGSQLEFHRPLAIGDALTRTSTIDNVTEKSGRTGTLVFVKVRHEIRRGDEGEAALTEFHDIVYREAARPGDAAPAPTAAPAEAAWEREWVPDDVLLFRYSALTFNGHRIHYDRRYVTQVEGYPGLIVHGPLQTILVLDLCRRNDRRPVRRLDYRALFPIFHGETFTVNGEPEADGASVKLWTANATGRYAMTASATF